MLSATPPIVERRPRRPRFNSAFFLQQLGEIQGTKATFQVQLACILDLAKVCFVQLAENDTCAKKNFLSDCPLEILLVILSHLPAKELMLCMRLNSYWFDVIIRFEHFLYKNLCRNTWGIDRTHTNFKQEYQLGLNIHEKRHTFSAYTESLRALLIHYNAPTYKLAWPASPSLSFVF